MHDHHDGDHRGVQFTTRQKVLLFSLLMVVGAGIFVGGMVVGRGKAPGMADPPEARDPAPSAQVVEAPAGHAVGIPIRSDPERASPAPQPAPPVPRPPPVATTSTLEQVSNQTPAAPGPGTAANPAPAGRADAPKPAATGKFTIQIAAFRDRVAAERMLAQLAKRGFEGYLEGTPSGIFRVRLGQFETREDARALAARLESEQFATLITSR